MSNGPNIPDAASSAASAKRGAGDAGANPMITRAASYTQLADEPVLNALPQRKSPLNRSLSENVLANMQGKAAKQYNSEQASETRLKAKRSLRRLSSFKRLSTQVERAPHFTISEFTIGPDESTEDLTYEAKPRRNGLTNDRERKTRSVSGSISNFARRPWISSSRSPSPSPSKRRSRREADAAIDTENSYPGEVQVPHATYNGYGNGQVKVPSRKNSLLGRKSRRPLSTLLGKTPSVDTPSVPPIPTSFSTDKLPSLNHKSSDLSSPPVPSVKSLERMQGLTAEPPRKKDPLWSVFRGIDGEYQKFQSRPSTLKTAVVRTALLPFLRTYAEHPSTLSLRPEDLDRRTVILNKWWTGLLEMLNGRHGESVSGNDRPAILEAVTALMVRAEWTLPTLTAITKSGKNPRASLKSRSTTSLGSTMTMSSDFLIDSVYHNVKNTFTQNLLAQMAYVVNKMSNRSAPASVVAFCGRATAYAFFYCDGVADILVRLWATPPETMRRVLTGRGLRKETALDPVALDKISTHFPPCLHPLRFKGLRSMTSYLRTRPQVPIATAYISWHGPWVGRWAGRDTDLFFIFAKFYTDLLCRFLPDDASPEETMAAPGWILVQAQILTILDSTMQHTNRSPPIDQIIGPSPITFDDMLGEADATATILSLPANGAIRSMAENRLIMLLRDCLSGSATMVDKAQSLFAQSFCSLLKLAARKTSVFDHNACFTLCDFLEEAIPILTRYYQSSVMTAIDWPFWLDVCKRMLQSQNTMTEVRLCSFLYSMWGAITADEDRKRQICMDWLLTEDVFQNQFCHWCPMVRAFYMRLLVWRLARPDGNSPDLDAVILETLNERLHRTWRHFLYLKENAEKHALAAPSTAACSPAPGRRLYIIRDDVQPAPSGMFLSFDGILSTTTTSKANPYERHSSRDPFSHKDANQLANGAQDPDRSSDGGKKRWNLLKSIIPSSNTPKDRSKRNSEELKMRLNGTLPSPASRREEPADRSKIDQVQARLGAPMATVDKAAEPVLHYRTLSFKFSLEYIDPENYPAGRERSLYPPKLPLPARTLLEKISPLNDDQENGPLKLEGPAVGPGKYAGRALSEWSLLIVECQNFFERRRAEGVPSHQVVETPTLGVEPFRKL